MWWLYRTTVFRCNCQGLKGACATSNVPANRQRLFLASVEVLEEQHWTTQASLLVILDWKSLIKKNYNSNSRKKIKKNQGNHKENAIKNGIMCWRNSEWCDSWQVNTNKNHERTVWVRQCNINRLTIIRALTRWHGNIRQNYKVGFQHNDHELFIFKEYLIVFSFFFICVFFPLIQQ